MSLKASPEPFDALTMFRIDIMGDLNAGRSFYFILLWTLVMQIKVAAAAPTCADSGGVQMCLVSSNADIFLLPEATEIHISLHNTTHTVQLKNGVFPALASLRSLWIDLRYIPIVDDDAFINLSDLQTLVFTNSDVYRPHNPRTFNANAFKGLKNLRELKAADTGLHMINSTSLHPLVSLTSVDFSDNLLSALPSSLFEKNTRLTSINLRKNQMTSIPEDLLTSLTDLVSLDFSENAITNITDGTFASNTNLQQLSLNNNMLTLLSPAIFGGLLNIATLKINDNKITSVDVHTFSSANKLESLDMSSNLIESLSDNSFSALPKLEFLELYNNKLKRLSSNSLSGLINLKYFDAYNNQIESIDDGAFRHSRQLVSLHLHYNKIRNISVSSFSGLNSLSALTLYNNSLTGLPMGLLSNLETLNLLDISGNPWFCDCSMFWLKAWFANSQDLKVENAGLTICANTGQSLRIYLNGAADECVTTTVVLQTSDRTTLGALKTSEKTTTFEPTTMAVIVIDDGGSEKLTPIPPEPNTLVSAKYELGDAEKGGIIAACIFVALFIIVLIVLFLYCRHKKYFFWKPQKVPKTASLHLKERQETERIVREQLRLAAQQNSHRFYDPEIGHYTWNNSHSQVHVVDNGVIVNGNYTIANDHRQPPGSIYTLPNSSPNLMLPVSSAKSSVSRATNNIGFMVSSPLPPNPPPRAGFSNMAFEDSGSEMSPVSSARQFHPSMSSRSSVPSLHHTTPLTESVVLNMLNPSSPTGPSGYLYPVNSSAREHQYAIIDGGDHPYNEHPYNTIDDKDLETLPVRNNPDAEPLNHTYQELTTPFDPRNYMIKPVDQSTPVSNSTLSRDVDNDTISKPPLDLDHDDDSTIDYRDPLSNSANSQCASISSVSTLDDCLKGAEGSSGQASGYKKHKPVPKPRKLRKEAAKNADEDFPPVFDES